MTDNPSWGTFHVYLADGNWKCGATSPEGDEETELAAIFDRLTESQRRRLGSKAEALARASRPA